MSADSGKIKLFLPYRSGKVTLSSRYGWRELGGVRDYHRGVDLVGEDKTIVSPCDGVIGASGKTEREYDATLTWQWGNFVRVDADTGSGSGMSIFLCHMESRAVKAGERVRAGDVLGREGNTGYSFGSHCHFETRVGGVSVDPTPYLGIENAWGEYDAAAQWVRLPEKGGSGMKKSELERLLRSNKPSDWARDAVEWAVVNGIIYGNGEGDLKLGENCTREQLVVMLKRLYDAVDVDAVKK